MPQPLSSPTPERARSWPLLVPYLRMCSISWPAYARPAAIMENQDDTQGHRSCGWGAASAAWGGGTNAELTPGFEPEQPGQSAIGTVSSKAAADAEGKAGAAGTARVPACRRPSADTGSCARQWFRRGT